MGAAIGEMLIDWPEAAAAASGAEARAAAGDAAAARRIMTRATETILID
jgi:hypothetical protein